MPGPRSSSHCRSAEPMAAGPCQLRASTTLLGEDRTRFLKLLKFRPLSISIHAPLPLANSLSATLFSKSPPTTDPHKQISQSPIPNPDLGTSLIIPATRHPSLNKKPKLPGCSVRPSSSCPAAFGTSAAAGLGKDWENGRPAMPSRMERGGAAEHPSGSSGPCEIGRTLLSVRGSWEGQGSSRGGCVLRGSCRGRVPPCIHGERLPLRGEGGGVEQRGSRFAESCS